MLRNNITELDELINAGAKLVCEKIGIPQKARRKKSKAGWEIRLETQIKKKSTKTVQKDKTKVRHWNMLGQKGNTTQGKIAVQLEEINQKVLAKEGRLKRYRQRVKQYRQNRAY